jgi:hypothetical protein
MGGIWVPTMELRVKQSTAKFDGCINIFGPEILQMKYKKIDESLVSYKWVDIPKVIEITDENGQIQIVETLNTESQTIKTTNSKQDSLKKPFICPQCKGSIQYQLYS